MSKGSLVAFAMAALLVLGGAFTVAFGAPPTADSADDVVDRWLNAMTERSGDRGWSWLSTDTQQAIYGSDPHRYWQDLDGVDWSTVAWAPARGHVDDGAFYLGDVWLRSHPTTLPEFLIERGLTTASCIDDAPYGIHVQMRLGWFNPPRITALIGKAGSADRCAAAFHREAGAPHEPFDLVGGAWGSPGPNQRIGVVDSSGMVIGVSWGRDNPPLDGPVAVSRFEPGELAVTWRGTSCDSNTALIVGATTPDLEIVIERGVEAACSASDVTYESILQLRSDIPVERVNVDLAR